MRRWQVGLGQTDLPPLPTWSVFSSSLDELSWMRRPAVLPLARPVSLPVVSQRSAKALLRELQVVPTYVVPPHPLQRRLPKVPLTERLSVLDASPLARPRQLQPLRVAPSP